MNYIMIKYENEEFWIEIDKENYAIRQIIISGDNIEISCINDCLAEGKIYLYELDGDITKIDKEKFGEIKDITDKGYYTNSYHVDVREKIDAFSKLKFESEFQQISSGGAISYIEIPNMKNNLKALEEIVKFIYENIQYAEFNTKSDYCHVCGFDGEIIINDKNEWECPQCGNKDHNKMNVTRRTCGYLGENFWNEGKTKEIKARVLHL